MPPPPKPALTLNIPIDALSFPHARALDEKKRDWLIKNIKEDTLDREGNPIPAFILPNELEHIRAAVANYSPDNGPFLACPHGRHRVAALRFVVPPREQWWTVNIYTDLTEQERDKFVKGM